MIRKSAVAALLLLFTITGTKAQNSATVAIDLTGGEHTISRHIYGHFAEHLGRGIYDGIWVGEDSDIPNINGARLDIVEALRNIRIPNLRWPGGCFADEYHWMDGIGPREGRPRMVNTHWGGVVEDNSFGTHEFLDLCELLETEPYICGNVGSGTVEEMAKWVEYITFDGESPMADLRRQNGREEPWKVKYWGVGNENWGCGGNMTAEYYAGEYRRYNTYCRNFSGNRLYRIAGGPNAADYHWMEVLMRETGRMMDGVSLHYYTVPDSWDSKGSAYEFTDEDYYRTISKALFMDELIGKHTAVMDKYDPDKRVQLIVDEWGAWYDAHPGSTPGFLYQMNTMRDAILAGVTFNIFHKYCDRVHMANIAQLVNVLQALILTEGHRMVLTPTYHVFDMYKVHHDATMLPVTVSSGSVGPEDSRFDRVSATASRNGEGAIHISLVNTDLDNDVTVTCDLGGGAQLKKGSGKMIVSEDIRDYNYFDDPEKVVMYDFDNFDVTGGKLTLTVPAKSLVTVSLI